MRAVYRQLTVVLLIASYLLATVGSWLHHSHTCALSRGNVQQFTVGCGLSCGDRYARSSANGGDACTDTAPSRPSSRARLEHFHQSDECLICRFLVLNKIVAVSSALAGVTQPVPEPLAVALPAWRVAELWATPDCRAPPHMA